MKYTRKKPTNLQQRNSRLLRKYMYYKEKISQLEEEIRELYDDGFFVDKNSDEAKRRKEKLQELADLKAKAHSIKEKIFLNYFRCITYVTYINNNYNSKDKGKGKAAMMYLPPEYELEDRIQEASIALFDTIDRYKFLEKDFQTYAISRMRYQVSRHANLRQRRGYIEVSQKVYRLIRKIKSVKSKLEKGLNREATCVEIAERLIEDESIEKIIRLLDIKDKGLSEEELKKMLEGKVKEMLELADRLENLEDLYYDGTNEPLEQVDLAMLKDRGLLQYDTSVEEETANLMFLQDIIDKTFRVLNRQERLVISSKFGLNDGIPKTNSELAEEFRVSESRIENIITNAYKKLREAKLDEISYTEILKDYLDASHEEFPDRDNI